MLYNSYSQIHLTDVCQKLISYIKNIFNFIGYPINLQEIYIVYQNFQSTNLENRKKWSVNAQTAASYNLPFSLFAEAICFSCIYMLPCYQFTALHLTVAFIKLNIRGTVRSVYSAEPVTSFSK